MMHFILDLSVVLRGINTIFSLSHGIIPFAMKNGKLLHLCKVSLKTADKK
jgi:hypothetical protein